MPFRLRYAESHRGTRYVGLLVQSALQISKPLHPMRFYYLQVVRVAIECTRSKVDLHMPESVVQLLRNFCRRSHLISLDNVGINVGRWSVV